MSDPYGEPVYVQPGQPGWYAPPPAPPQAAPPPGRKRRVHPAVLVVAGICVAAAVVGLLVALLAGHDRIDAPGTSGRRLAIPADIPGYTPVTDVPVDDLKANLGEQLADDDQDPADVVRHAAVGVWKRDGRSGRVLFIGLALRDIPSLRDQVRKSGVRGALAFFMAGVDSGSTSGPTPASYPPGPRGGFMRCTTTQISGTPAAVCGWGDESALALTVLTEGPGKAEAADVTRYLRKAIERG